jgi:hypothetical protein
MKTRVSIIAEDCIAVHVNTNDLHSNPGEATSFILLNEHEQDDLIDQLLKARRKVAEGHLLEHGHDDYRKDKEI